MGANHHPKNTALDKPNLDHVRSVAKALGHFLSEDQSQARHAGTILDVTIMSHEWINKVRSTEKRAKILAKSKTWE